MFYARDRSRNTIEGWDLRVLSCPKRIVHRDHDHQSIKSGSVLMEYLVESLGDILLVVRHQTQRFDVFKADLEQETVVLLELVECLGDRVLFLGVQQSLSVSARDFPELKPNSIYFTHDYDHDSREWPHGDYYDMGIYCLEDDSITTLFDNFDTAARFLFSLMNYIMSNTCVLRELSGWLRQRKRKEESRIKLFFPALYLSHFNLVKLIPCIFFYIIKLRLYIYYEISSYILLKIFECSDMI